MKSDKNKKTTIDNIGWITKTQFFCKNYPLGISIDDYDPTMGDCKTYYKLLTGDTGTEDKLQGRSYDKHNIA